MTAPKQVDFVDGTTIVAAEFLDRIQEIQAGLAVNAALAISGTNVVLNAGSGNDVCSMTIDEKFRYIESPQVVSFSGSDSTGSYSIWATTSNTDSNPGFTLTKTAGTTIPVADNYRRIGSVSWNSSTSTLSALTQIAGYSGHGYMHTSGIDPLPSGSITSAQILDGTITLSDLATSLQQLLVPTGTILPYAGASSPTSDYLICDGAPVSRSVYSSLFSALGGTSSPYGLGNGTTTFNVPDLRGRIPVGAGTGLGLNASGTGVPSGAAMSTRSRGEWGGEETHLNLASESGLPSHTHVVSAGYYLAGGTGGNNFRITDGSGSYVGGVSTSAEAQAATNASIRHNNVQPFTVTNYIIKV